MIKNKGIINIHNGHADTTELMESIYELDNGEYGYLIFDKEKNKALPQLKYLFGVVLKTISDQLPGNPDVGALYSYFEEIYAPIRTATIAGEKYEYFDLKSEKSIEVNDVIERIIHHAKKEWNIDPIPSKEALKFPEAKEVYAGAYAAQWDNYSRKI